MTNSKWAVTKPLLPASSWHLIPWKTESECHCHSFLLGIYLMTSHNPQQVSGTSLLFFTSHYIPWPTDSEWQHHFPLPGSLILSHPMTTASEWCCPIFCNLAVPSSDSMTIEQFVGTTAIFSGTYSLNTESLFPWWIGCEWHTLSFCYVASSHGQQLVSHTTLSFYYAALAFHNQ